MKKTSLSRALHASLASLGLALGAAATAGDGLQLGRELADPLVGVWVSVVTQRDCASGTALVSFRGQQAVHAGGTLTDVGLAPPGARGPGLGLWQRAQPGQYTMRFRFARFFPDGNLAGTTVVTRQVVMSADGLQLAGHSRTELLDPSGTVVAVGCATDIAERFQ